MIGLISTALPLLVFTLSLQYMSSGVLTVFVALIPMFTGLMAHLLLTQEKLNTAKLAGLLVAFGGVVVLLVSGTTGLSTGAGALDVRGPVLALSGVLIGSFGTVYTRRQVRHVNVVSLSAGQTLVAALVLAPLGLGVGAPSLPTISRQAWIAVGYTGLIGSFLAFLIIFQLIRQFGATSSALVTYIMPLVAGLFGALLLDEVITLPLAIGAVLILLGVLLAERAAAPSPAPAVVAPPVDELRKDPCLMC